MVSRRHGFISLDLTDLLLKLTEHKTQEYFCSLVPEIAECGVLQPQIFTFLDLSMTLRLKAHSALKMHKKDDMLCCT